MNPSIADIDFVASSHLSPQASLFWGVLVLLLGGGTIVALFFQRAYELARRGELEARAAETPSDLVRGPNKIVRGKVEPEGPSPVAVRVEVRQTVKNHTSKNNHWHTWEESHRRTDAHPFYLTRDTGEVVLVEPGDDVFVIDDMKTTHANCGHTQRMRYCDVEAGEVFSAYGTLVRGAHPRATGAYRDGAAGFILKPPASGRMYLASSSIKDRFSERIKYLRRWGVGAALVFTGYHAVITMPFMAAATLGEVEPARVVAHRSWVTRNKNSTTTHYAVSVLTDGGDTFEREVTYFTYATLCRLEQTDARIPTLHFGTWATASYLGDRATLNGVAVIFALGSGIVAAIVFAVNYGSKFAWYDRKTLSEHGGSGHYTGPPPNV
jgi:hypothetical protein